MKKFRVFVFTFVFIIFAVASFSACELTHVKMPSTDVENPETPNPDNLEPDNPDDPPVNSDGEIPPDNSVLKEITGIEFPSVTAGYDGKEPVAEIAGELPEGVTVSYFNNVGVDAYIYVAEATLSGEGYRTLTLKTMINIKRADFKGVIFESATFAYDGDPHCVLVSGNLPEGTTIQYLVRESPRIVTEDFPYLVVNRGKYKVTAVLKNKNYNTKVYNAEICVI